MTKEEIVEGNKLIAEFMQLNQGWFFHEDDEDYLNPKGYTKYHLSWDWLMKVVEQIEGINLSIPRSQWIDNKQPDTFRVDIINRGMVEILRNGEDCISSVLCGNKIEALWTAIVEFLRWGKKSPLAPALLSETNGNK